MDLEERIIELSGYGYGCSQILMILLLDTVGEENPGLVRSMQGLNGGIGGTENICGCMAAGCCLISYLTGKPDDTGYENTMHDEAIDEFTRWFAEGMTSQYGGVECRDIVGDDTMKRIQYCPEIMAATYEKCMEILENRGLL